MAKMMGDAQSISFGGREYRADEDGVFDVPADAVAALAAHGLVLVADEPKPAPKPDPKPDAKVRK